MGVKGVGAELNIPDEALAVAVEAYDADPGILIRQGVAAALAAAAPLIVAAELDRLGRECMPLGDDVETEEDEAYDEGRAFVSSALRRRAAELRGE